MTNTKAAQTSATKGAGVVPKNATISLPEANPAPIIVPIISMDTEKILNIL